MEKEQITTNLDKLMNVVNKVTGQIGAENLALSVIAIANLIWPLSFLYVNQHHFSPFQTTLARGVSVCFTHIAICLFLGISLDFKSSQDLKYLIIRNSLIIVNQVIYTGMHFVLSFPLINSICVTGPLFVFIIDYYLNGVTINRSQIIGIVLGFIGVFININGDYFMTYIDETYQPKSTFEHYEVTDIKLKILYSFILVLANVIWGYAIVCQKNIKHVPGIKISYFLGIQFVVTSGAAINLGAAEPVSLYGFLCACVFSGFIMSLCQIMFVSALNLSKNTGKLTILILLYGVSSYCISFFKYQQKINGFCVFGLCLMGYGLYRTIFSR